MKVGEKAELIIKPEYGYGAAGHPPMFPKNATLYFTIKLISINSDNGSRNGTKEE